MSPFRNLRCYVQYKSQLCARQHSCLPKTVVDALGLKIGDFIRIRTLCSNYFVTQLVNVEDRFGDIALNGDVCTENLCKKIFSVKEIELLKRVSLSRVRVEIVLRSVKELLNWKKANREKLVLEFLHSYCIVSKCTVKCSRNDLSRLGVHLVRVTETYLPDNKVGRAYWGTKIDINVVSGQMHYQKDDVEKNVLGGLSEPFGFCRNAIESCFTCTPIISKGPGSQFVNEMLVTGPSGSGKSSFVKKLAYDSGAYVEVRCSKLVDLLPYEYELYIDSVTKDVKLQCELHGRCILLIDDIDYITSSSFFDFHAVEVIFRLILLMRSKKVFVIGTATSAKALHPQLRRLGMFNQQIQFGVPTCEQRESIVHTVVLRHDVNPDFDARSVAKMSSGFVAADLSSALTRAKRKREEDDDDISRKQAEQSRLLVSIENVKEEIANTKPLILNNVGYDWRLKARPVKWDEIGGMEKIKGKILKRMEVTLERGQSAQYPWLPSTGGVLLFGPPGCCKTTLVCALATKFGATFFSASAAQIYSAYVGDSEKCISQLFHQARLCSPSVIFLDELDSLVGKRAERSGKPGVQEKVLAALLNEMDGVGMNVESIQGLQKSNMILMEGDKPPSLPSFTERKSNSGIVVIGASNRVDLIDEALLRPGRFDLLQYMGPPNRKDRESILKTFSEKMCHRDVDFAALASKTIYYSGADLQLLWKKAAGYALERPFSQGEVTHVDFDCALKTTVPSLSKEDILMYAHFSKKYVK